MALFGIGYAISKGVGFIAGAITGRKSAREQAERVAAVVTLPFDPAGSIAALAMPSVKEAAKNGNKVCQAVIAGTVVLQAADLLQHSAEMAGLTGNNDA